jgi:hypothetical protein
MVDVFAVRRGRFRLARDRGWGELRFGIPGVACGTGVSSAGVFRVRPKPNCFAIVDRRALYAGAVNA